VEELLKQHKEANVPRAKKYNEQPVKKQIKTTKATK